MRRTQIYLDEELYAALQKHSQRSGHSVSESIRQILRQNLKRQSHDFIQALDDIVGIWQDKSEDVEAYLRALRQDRRHDLRQ